MKTSTNITLLIICILAAIIAPVQAQVVINEVMAQNSNTISDPDYGESADWVELYNKGAEDVDQPTHDSHPWGSEGKED